MKFLAPLFCLLVTSSVANAACDLPPRLSKPVDYGSKPVRHGEIKVFDDNNAFVFTTFELETDVDGSPDAYGPDNMGVDSICNGAVAFDATAKRCVFGGNGWQTKCLASFKAAKAEKWVGPTKMCSFGFKADGGFGDGHGHVIGAVPVQQGASGPHPGYYVSLSSLKRPETDQFKGDVQERQVDAINVPYFVLPPDVVAASGAQKGDIAALWRHIPGTHASDVVAFGVFADGGPAEKLGEASVKMIEMLHGAVSKCLRDVDPANVNSRNKCSYEVDGVSHTGTKRVTGGIDGVSFVVFPGSAKLAPIAYQSDAEWTRKIQEEGMKLFDGPSGWGGLSRLRSCRDKQQ